MVPKEKTIAKTAKYISNFPELIKRNKYVPIALPTVNKIKAAI